MKKTIYSIAVLIAFMCSCATLCAQTEVDIDGNGRPYAAIFDSLGTGLIATRIPYGTLYDRVYGWSGLSSWNNSDTTSSAHLFQTWSDAEQSVMSAAARPNNYPTMRTTVQQDVFINTLPIIAVNFQFGYFDSTCVQDGRVTVTNGMLRDNNGASPYLTKQVTIAGIGIDSVFANANYSLLYNNTFLLNNTSTTIQNITLNNVTSGVQYIFTSGAAQTIRFTQSGNNVLKFTVKLSNGSSFITNQVIKVKIFSGGGAYSRMGTGNTQLLGGTNCAPTSQLLTSDIPFKGYGETQATNSYADYHIFYHATSSSGTACEQILKKPIIILDGFDPGDARTYLNIYNDYLKNKDDGSSVADNLRKQGYDIIILNFPRLGEVINDVNGSSVFTVPSNVKVNGTTTTINAIGRDGGADYIERNAFLLVKLIQQINATLATNSITEKLVVVGPSMGGQISRYALAYMEKQQSLGVANMNHNCRLWVSFDSPHSGANIPMTVQETLRFFGTEGGNTDAHDVYQNQLQSPAARQLLIEQLDGQNSTANYHNTYYTNLKNNGLAGSNGYPMNLRKVTLLNGTGNGTQTYGDYKQVLNGVGRKTFLNIKVFELTENFLPSYNQNNRITLEKVTIPRFLSITFINRSYNVTNINPRGSMDAVQGSTIPTINDIYTRFSDGLTDQKVRQSWDPLNTTVNPPVPTYPNHCFIPSISALGFKNSSFDWNNAVNNRNLLCNSEINFDNYYIPTTNQPHIYLNTNNIDWLTQELNKGQPGCPKICSFAIVGGSNPLCTTANTTYNLDVNVPNGVTTQWSTTPGLHVVSYTLNSVTVKEVANPTTSTITATIVNPCGANTVIARTILTGPPSITNIDYSMDNSGCSAGYQRWSLAATANTTVTSWKWTIDNAANNSWYISSPNSSSTYVNVINGTGGGITVSATNGCGTGKNGVTIWSPCGAKHIHHIAPNPAHNQIIVSTISEGNNIKSSQDLTYAIKIIDRYGVMRKSFIYKLGILSTTISVADLNAGTYLVSIFDGKDWSSEKLIVQ